MYKVQYKSHNGAQAWSTHGSYGSESSALNEAQRIAGKNFMVRLRDLSGQVIWSS